MLDTATKKEIIKKYQIHEKDSGSSQVQIAILRENIAKLTEHLKVNRKDLHSRRGLIKLVSTRKKLLNYLKRTDEASFKDIVSKLSLRV